MVINASEFKAKCLAILDEVSATGEAVTILKRGKPVAELVPPVSTDSRYPQDDLRESVVIKGDVVEPVLPAEAWEAVAGSGD
ncbi:MAG: type II toxin-antitoxin system Phd/YefM family antitoxin [bacterium]|nr:type II toxin-antitoxin system Phd/YefM family antitoxin [bacterium]